MRTSRKTTWIQQKYKSMTYPIVSWLSTTPRQAVATVSPCGCSDYYIKPPIWLARFHQGQKKAGNHGCQPFFPPKFYHSQFTIHHSLFTRSLFTHSCCHSLWDRSLFLRPMSLRPTEPDDRHPPPYLIIFGWNRQSYQTFSQKKHYPNKSSSVTSRCMVCIAYSFCTSPPDVTITTIMA